MIRFLALLSFAAFFCCAPAQAGEPVEAAEVRTVLSAFHEAASKGDWPRYFSLMADGAVFLGTDAGEHWDKATFRSYAEKTKGWTYTQREVHVYVHTSGNTAWFDEILDSAAYGTSRGTGVLSRTAEGWKIEQYHLTFPIPNDLAKEFTQRIQAFEKNPEH